MLARFVGLACSRKRPARSVPRPRPLGWDAGLRCSQRVAERFVVAQPPGVLLGELNSFFECADGVEVLIQAMAVRLADVGGEGACVVQD